MFQVISCTQLPPPPLHSQVQEGKCKFAVVFGKQSFVGNDVQSKLGGGDLCFASLDPIELIR